MKEVLRASKNLEDDIKNMERYLIFLDNLSGTAPNLMRARKQEELHVVKDYEKYIKSNFEKYMKCIAEVKAKIEKL